MKSQTIPGRVLASHVGQEFEDYIQQEILKPLGMGNTGFNYTEEVVSQMAVGYSFDGSPAPLSDIGNFTQHYHRSHYNRMASTCRTDVLQRKRYFGLINSH